MSAIVIVASAILFPLYFLVDENLALPTAGQWVLIILYLVSVLGFALLAVGVKIKNVTSVETDKKIREIKVAFDKAAKPYVIFILVCIMIWMAYVLLDLKYDF